MKISQGLALLPGVGETTQSQQPGKRLHDTDASFGDTLAKAVTDVNGLQIDAGKAVERMVTGEAADIHEVMIAVEKARTSFDLLMEIRNKAIDMYREVMRMQV